MDIFLVIGIILGALAVIVGTIVKGANVAALLNPAAAIIILVGTTAAVMNSFPKNEFLNIPKVLKALFRENTQFDSVAVIETIVQMSHTARKEGLLSLEHTIHDIENPFMQKGVTLVIDGMENDRIREILEVEIENTEERHRANASIFSSAGSYAPTLGVLGAVIGLIGALGNLSDVEKLGHMIAAAFVATLYGIFIGYVLCHPISTRLKRKSSVEIKSMQLILEGVLALQSGENPSNIQLKLTGMLDPKDRLLFESRNNKEMQGNAE